MFKYLPIEQCHLPMIDCLNMEYGIHVIHATIYRMWQKNVTKFTATKFSRLECLFTNILSILFYHSRKKCLQLCNFEASTQSCIPSNCILMHEENIYISMTVRSCFHCFSVYIEFRWWIYTKLYIWLTYFIVSQKPLVKFFASSCFTGSRKPSNATLHQNYLFQKCFVGCLCGIL